MPTILKQHDNCRLYVKGKPPFPRYFVSEKTEKLRRVQITKESAAGIKHLPANDFTQGVAAVLDNAKNLGSAEYFEVTI